MGRDPDMWLTKANKWWWNQFLFGGFWKDSGLEDWELWELKKIVYNGNEGNEIDTLQRKEKFAKLKKQFGLQDSDFDGYDWDSDAMNYDHE